MKRILYSMCFSLFIVTGFLSFQFHKFFYKSKKHITFASNQDVTLEDQMYGSMNCHADDPPY